MPRVCELYPGICLATEEKAQETSVRVERPQSACSSQAPKYKKNLVFVHKLCLCVPYDYHDRGNYFIKRNKLVGLFHR